jgi:malonyl-CoA/methylmalonyl-CoA synthetase
VLKLSPVTLLAILALRSIAVPLSPGFPTPELQYILDNSQASLLLSSDKFRAKADEAVSSLKQDRPSHVLLQEHAETAAAAEPVELVQEDLGSAGLMLYTSGTTNRPVSPEIPPFLTSVQALTELRKE